MDKRLQFVIGTVIFSLIFFFLKFVPFNFKYQAIGISSLVLGLLFYLLFRRSTKNNKDLIICSSFPIVFSVTLALFRFLFAQNLWWEIAIIILFVIVLYSLFLLENVFLVTLSHKTVPLYRAAVTVGFLLTLGCAFLLYNVIFSFRFGPWLNSIWVFASSFLLLLHYFWFVNLSPSSEINIWHYSLIFSLLLGEMSLSLSFWPANTAKTSLFIASSFYVFGGLTQAKAQGKLFKRTVKEFIWLGIGIFIALILVTNWT